MCGAVAQESTSAALAALEAEVSRMQVCLCVCMGMCVCVYGSVCKCVWAYMPVCMGLYVSVCMGMYSFGGRMFWDARMLGVSVCVHGGMNVGVYGYVFVWRKKVLGCRCVCV